MIRCLDYKILKAQSHKWRWALLQKNGDSFQSKKFSLFFLSLCTAKELSVDIKTIGNLPIF
jgi:hypothetical protein